MNVKDKDQTKKSGPIYFTGLGLIIGTAIGAGLSIVLTGNVVWAGVGTGVGIIVGAIIDGYKKK